MTESIDYLSDDIIDILGPVPRQGFPRGTGVLPSPGISPSSPVGDFPPVGDFQGSQGSSGTSKGRKGHSTPEPRARDKIIRSFSRPIHPGSHRCVCASGTHLRRANSVPGLPRQGLLPRRGLPRVARVVATPRDPGVSTAIIDRFILYRALGAEMIDVF